MNSKKYVVQAHAYSADNHLVTFPRKDIFKTYDAAREFVKHEMEEEFELIWKKSGKRVYADFANMMFYNSRKIFSRWTIAKE